VDLHEKPGEQLYQIILLWALTSASLGVPIAFYAVRRFFAEAGRGSFVTFLPAIAAASVRRAGIALRGNRRKGPNDRDHLGSARGGSFSDGSVLVSNHHGRLRDIG